MAVTNNVAGTAIRIGPNCSHSSETYHGLPQSGRQMGRNMSNGARQMGKKEDGEDWLGVTAQRSGGQMGHLTGQMDL